MLRGAVASAFGGVSNNFLCWPILPLINALYTITPVLTAYPKGPPGEGELR
jgi:hypothetical protein